MASLTRSLPAPTKNYQVYDETGPAEAAVAARPEPPGYGQRNGFVPRSNEDFGDGGAFPEIHVAQYPLDIGRPGTKSSTALVAVSVGADGTVDHTAIVKQGSNRDKTVFSKFTDLVEKEFDEDDLERPSEEEELKTAAKTRAAMEQLVTGKIAAAHPLHIEKSKGARDPKFVRYTPDVNTPGYNANAKQRVIRMVEAQVDPMEPPSFKHKKVARGPPEAPVPVMHSPPRKVTVQDQQAWKIPPCVSNWKNAKGYTIPLDKRLAADGRGLQEVTINDNFASLAESLYIAERKAREEVKYRSTIQKKISQKEKEQQEAELRDLASKARLERQGISVGGGRDESRDTRDERDDDSGAENRDEDDGPETREDRDEQAQRDKLRVDRKREREREMRLENLGKKSKTQRDGDRDVSEKIALGQMTGGGKLEGEAQFDSRLFNQSGGMDSGFGQEDDYGVYTKKLFDKGEEKIYTARGDESSKYGDAEEQYKQLTTTSKFRPDKDFQGVDRDAPQNARDGPVAFERETQEKDPFGLDQFLTETKKGKKAIDDLGGRGGSMRASAGGAGKSEDYEGGSSRSKIDFRGEGKK